MDRVHSHRTNRPTGWACVTGWANPHATIAILCWILCLPFLSFFSWECYHFALGIRRWRHTLQHTQWFLTGRAGFKAKYFWTGNASSFLYTICWALPCYYQGLFFVLFCRTVEGFDSKLLSPGCKAFCIPSSTYLSRLGLDHLSVWQCISDHRLAVCSHVFHTSPLSNSTIVIKTV